MQTPYQLPILLYHRVVNSTCRIGKHKTYVWESAFRKQMQWLKDNGYQTITFSDLDALPANADPGKKIIITFDDGYTDNYTIAFPILKEFGFKAVIYLVTGYKCNEWNLHEGEPALELMSKEQILEMQNYGIEFGGHTRHHVDLKNSTADKQREEVTGCFNDVATITGKKPLSFAYPYGAYNNDTLKVLAQSGFKYGITTIFGPHNWPEDLLRIRRIEVRPKDGLFAFRRKASGRYFNRSWYHFLFAK